LILTTPRREASVMQFKLDELIRVARGTHHALLDLQGVVKRRVFCAKQRALPRRSSELMPHRRLPAPLQHGSLQCNALHLAA
jgi:hypothetical protein